MDEVLACLILKAAIAEERCAELLNCLFDGGSATISDGRLVLISCELLKGFTH